MLKLVGSVRELSAGRSDEVESSDDRWSSVGVYENARARGEARREREQAVLWEREPDRGGAGRGGAGESGRAQARCRGWRRRARTELGGSHSNEEEDRGSHLYIYIYILFVLTFNRLGVYIITGLVRFGSVWIYPFIY